jgi:putative two-component system response regulator
VPVAQDSELALPLNPGLGRIKADPEQPAQILLNLVVNAHRAMPQGGKLTVETANLVLDEAYPAQRTTLSPGSYVIWSVTDPGAGIGQATHQLLFEPFFAANEKGTGPGRSIVYGMVHQLGGFICVEGVPERGATFRIYLPRVEARIHLCRPRLPGACQNGSETVLLAGGEPALREARRGLLEEWGDRVPASANKVEAIQRARQYENPVHWSTAHVVMPGMNGPNGANPAPRPPPQSSKFFWCPVTPMISSAGRIRSMPAPRLSRGPAQINSHVKPRHALAPVPPEGIHSMSNHPDPQDPLYRFTFSPDVRRRLPGRPESASRAAARDWRSYRPAIPPPCGSSPLGSPRSAPGRPTGDEALAGNLPGDASSARILVADDSEDCRRLLARLLESNGLQVICARDGREALGILESQPIDLALLDVRMPHQSGYALCSRLKSNPETRFIPVVLITGLNQTEDRIQGILAGADDFLTKPFHTRELLARVHSALRAKQSTDGLENAEAVLFTLALSIEAKDPWTEEHCQRLSIYAVALGAQLGLARDQLLALRRGAIVHDIGKVAVPEQILLKPGPLTADERKVMEQHTVIGERICAPLKTFRQVLPIIRHHHERLDGSGYPDGLTAGQLPLTARILTTVDIYDALTTDRPYRPALSPPEALAQLKKEVQLGWRDGLLVEEFERLLRNPQSPLSREVRLLRD